MSCLHQVSSVENKFVDDIFIKSMEFKKKGDAVHQHSHSYDHVTMIATGGLEVFVDGQSIGKYNAPYGLTILAHVKHKLVALKDNTLAYCIHNLKGKDYPSIHEENHIPEIKRS
jgi:quercetin dioxygenase-like cupin family protein